MEDGRSPRPFSRHLHRSFRRCARGQESGAETSLGTLILAAQFLDFLWPVFVLLGIEHVRIALGSTRVSPLDFTDYPISHRLLIATVWAIPFAEPITHYAAMRGAPWYWAPPC
jgi:hypothetical protein